MIRLATESDLGALYIMARRFVEESDLPFTFDLEATHRTLYHAVKRENQILLVDYDEEHRVICGGIMGHVSQDFCKEKAAYVSKMYVQPEFRGLGPARELVEGFEIEARRLGATICFSSATAGMGGRVEALFVRLFEKFGYEVLGRVLAKELRE